MTSPPLTDQKPREDPTEGLRVLVADLQALVARLELKERTPGLQATLQAAQERVAGPRALVVLLSEHAELKRRFLERLLGPNLALVPNPTTACTRLEYGAEAEYTAPISQRASEPAALPLDPLQSFLSRDTKSDASGSIADASSQATQTIRLPNPTLKGGLAVIDTPVVENGEPAASVLACIEQSDAWILVLNADHSVSDATQALLGRLPELGARLEIVVENAEVLTGEERIAARNRLMQTLRERCNIEAPRLTLVASAATEGDEGDFWHGRFATFHSVMMLRGRERWLEGTRTLLLDALSKVGAEIDLELKSIDPGVRHSRLRLGMKDLDGLRARFHELAGGGGLDIAPSANVKPASPPLVEPATRNRLDEIWGGVGDDSATETKTTGSPSPLVVVADAVAAMADDSTAETSSATGKDPTVHIGGPAIQPAVIPAKSAVEPTPVAKPTFVRSSGQAAKPRPKHGVSVHLSGSLKQLMPRDKTAAADRIRLLKRIVWIALLIAFVCLILWALAPRGFLFGQEPPAEWDYQQPKAALASRAPPATRNPDTKPVRPGDANSLPDTTHAARPNIPVTPLAKHRGSVRTPLVRPIPSEATAGAPQRAKRRHRHLLGLGKLWHWVRHPRGDKSDQNSQ